MGGTTRVGQELLLVVVGLAGVLTLQLTVVDGWYLLDQWFWMDEWFTFLTADSRTFQGMWASYSAWELHPPLYPVIVWGASRLAGQASETLLRAVSLAAVFSALIGCYLMLRRTFRVDVAVGAVACVWSLGSVHFHAFDARFYALWLACAIWFAWFVACALEQSRGSRLGLAASATALCAAYLFGVLVWALVMSSAILPPAPMSRGRRLRALWPACLGPMLAMPFLVQSVWHSQTFEGGSWIEPVTARIAVAFLTSLLVPSQLALAAVCAGVGVIVGRSTSAQADADSSRLLLLSFGVLPFGVLAVSALGVPVTMERYAFPAVLSTAVIAATVLSRAPAVAVTACAVLWLGQSTLGLRRSVEFNRAADAQSAALISQVRELVATGSPVLIESVQQYSIIDRYAPDLRERVQVLDFERGDLRADLSSETGLRERVEVRLFERDLARRAAAGLGRPRLIGVAAVRARNSTAWLILRRDDEPVVWVGGLVHAKHGRVARIEFAP